MSMYFCLFTFWDDKNTTQILIIGYATVQNDPNSYLSKGGFKMFGSIKASFGLRIV